jgi:phage tail sheath protein FI
VIYRYGNISTAPDSDRSLPSVMPQLPERRSDALSSPLSCTLADGVSGDDVLTALFELFDAAALNPPATSVEGPRYLITLTGGDDGAAPQAVDYGGESDEVNGSTGFAALEDIEDVSIVMAPAAAADAAAHQAIVVEMQKHCLKMRYRVGIIDARDGMSMSEVRDFRSNFDDTRLALYYPWVITTDPSGQRQSIAAPPAGFIAGVYASTDVRRGVHKAPANEPVIGALGFAQEINRFQQELLNPDGINCLRSFPGRGHRVWGGRTLSSDPEWKYVNVRRYFLYLERSIDKGTQWVVFEPNGERLWANVRTTVEDFLYNEWFNGHLLGSTPKTAYFVRCDRSTMTQNDLDNGRLVCEIGVAPLRPAEFVIFRIGQKTADA